MTLFNSQIGYWLGTQPPATEADILQIVEGQLAPSIVKRLIALGLQRSEIDRIVIPSRTLQHRRSRREKLTVMRLIRILSSAESVYGNLERALAWLRTPHSQLADRTPLSLLNTDTGSRIVAELLIQIDEGMFV